jgi:hypothetical protein
MRTLLHMLELIKELASNFGNAKPPLQESKQLGHRQSSRIGLW